jgi:hypothetical protein
LEKNSLALEKAINMIRNYLYSWGLNSADVEKSAFSSLDNESFKLRKTQSEKYLFVELFLNLFTNSETTKKFKVFIFFLYSLI